MERGSVDPECIVPAFEFVGAVASVVVIHIFNHGANSSKPVTDCKITTYRQDKNRLSPAYFVICCRFYKDTLGLAKESDIVGIFLKWKTEEWKNVETTDGKKSS